MNDKKPKDVTERLWELERRVAELEIEKFKPSPAPEPPKASGPDHNCPDDCVSESSKCPTVGWYTADNLLPMCPSYTPPKNECSSQPESILPAAVLATFDGLERDIMWDIVDCDDEDRAEAARMFSLAKQRLATLWPKAGQPSPVTAEKLADILAAEDDQERPTTAHAFYLFKAEAILKAFPTLGQGRLTRGQIMTVLDKHRLYPAGAVDATADDLLALHGPVTVSKETEAIKAVALVAELAYREVFHVDEPSTTPKLHLLGEAIAALDRTTPAPEPSKTYEKCMCGHDIALHSTQFGRCAVKGCNCTRPKPIPTIQPEASQPAPLPPQSELDKCAADELRRIEASTLRDLLASEQAATLRKVGEWLDRISEPGLPDSQITQEDIDALRAGKMPEGWKE